MIAGRYTLLRELGRGASGAVWLAQDAVLGREVAMKRLSRGADEHAEARAWREARLAARLQHRHLVAVYDVVEDDAHLWLVLEYVAGTTLSRLITARGALSPDDAAALLAPLADGLRHAHASGIVHRDVKPSNVLIDVDRQPKLSDFGIARGLGHDLTLTQTGMVHGSPAYLAPEVASGGRANEASDVWSLGATLFQMLTGRPPYEDADGNVVAILYRVVHEPVPRTDRAGWLGPLLTGMLTRDPEQRWTLAQVQSFLAAGPPSALPIAAEAPRLMPSHTAQVPQTAIVTPAPAPAVRRRRSGAPLALVAAAAVLVVLIGIVVMLVHRGGSTTASDDGSAPESPLAVTSGDPSALPSTAASSPTGPSRPPSGATEQGVRDFVAAYLQTAPKDPARSLQMLTPAYRRESGGLRGYRGFWSNVVDIRRVTPVQATTTPPTATYTYTYRLRGHGLITETVTLELQYAGGRYRIDGATSVRH